MESLVRYLEPLDILEVLLRSPQVRDNDIYMYLHLLIFGCYQSYLQMLSLYPQRSEKQREADLAKNKQETLDDDLEVIEPVVDEPKERRPKGRGKRKSQRR